jgi:hypothetical protein
LLIVFMQIGLKAFFFVLKMGSIYDVNKLELTNAKGIYVSCFRFSFSCWDIRKTFILMLLF